MTGPRVAYEHSLVESWICHVSPGDFQAVIVQAAAIDVPNVKEMCAKT